MFVQLVNANAANLRVVLLALLCDKDSPVAATLHIEFLELSVEVPNNSKVSTLSDCNCCDFHLRRSVFNLDFRYHVIFIVPQITSVRYVVAGEYIGPVALSEFAEIKLGDTANALSTLSGQLVFVQMLY